LFLLLSSACLAEKQQRLML